MKGDILRMDHLPGPALYVFPGWAITVPNVVEEVGHPGADYMHVINSYENGGLG